VHHSQQIIALEKEMLSCDIIKSNTVWMDPRCFNGIKSYFQWRRNFSDYHRMSGSLEERILEMEILGR
jgi:hypothetical protein